MMKMTKESMVKQLRDRGLKITAQRLAIIEVLVEHGHLHPGARFVDGGRGSSQSAKENREARHGYVERVTDGKESAQGFRG